MDLPFVEAHVDAARDTWRPGDAWLGGGTWLFSEPQPGVRRLLDLQAFGWPALTWTGDGLEIAATCTFAELAAYEGPGATVFGFCCDALLGSFKVAESATVGGNLCLALPAAPMAALAVALDATCVLWSAAGERELPAIEFVVDVRHTALADGELLRAIRIPVAALSEPVAMRRASLTRHGRSAALLIGRSGRLTVAAATRRPVSVPLDEPGALDALHYYDDVHGHPAWRAARTRALAAEIVAELAA